MKNFYCLALFAALILCPFAGFSQCLSGWNYLQPVTLTNTLPQTLTDFQVKVTVNTMAPIGAGHMNASGNDIRFTDAACNEVDYWIESGINSASTVIWLKVPVLGASGNTTVNMYYGNPAAPAESNGDSVFLLFDDFNDGVFNSSKWEVRGTPATLTESGGKLTIVGNSNWEYVRTLASWNVPTVIETREMTTGGSTGMLLGYAGTDFRYTFRAGASGKGTTEDPDVSMGNDYFDQNYPGVPHPVSTYHDYAIQADLISGVITLNQFCNLTTSNCNNTTTPLNSSTGTGYYLGFTSYNSNFGAQNVDWVKVRAYASADPTSVSGTETPNLFITSTLSFSAACAGSAQTVNFNAPGTYNPGNIFSAELSDATGSFTAPTVIGTLASTASGAQSMPVILPASASGSQYRIRVTSSNVVMGGSNNGSDIVINPLPNVTATATAMTICNGDADTLIVTGAMTYIWSSGPMASQIIVTPSAPTTYVVTGTDMNGCTASDTLMIAVNPAPVLTVTGDSVICFGESDSLWVSGASAYVWSTSDMTAGIEVSPGATTTYTVDGTDANGCSSQSQFTVTVDPLPVLMLSSSADTLCDIDGVAQLNGMPAGGMWTGPGVMGTMFDPSIAGPGTSSAVYMYTDAATGCSAADSLSLYVDICMNVENTIAANTLELYPNPNAATFVMRSATTIGYVEITDALGRIVHTANVQSTQTSISIDGLAQGIYTVHAQGTAIKFAVQY